MNSGESRTLLSGVPIFAELSARSLRKLADLCVAQSFGAGEPLIEQGDTGLGLFLVTDGEVEVFRGGADGDDRESLAVLGSGQVVGEMSLIDDRPRSASVVALRPTQALLISRNGFRQLVKKEPEIAWCFVPVLVERLREALAQQHLVDVAPEHRTANLHRPEAGESVPVETAPDDVLPDDAAAEPMPDVWRDPSEPAGAEADDGRRADGPTDQASASGVRGLLRTQHAMGRAGLALAEQSVSVLGQLLDTLVDEVGLDNGRSTAEVLRAMPAGTAKACAAAVREAGKSPGRVVDAFRNPSRRRRD